MQASVYIIVRNSFSMNFSIRGSSDPGQSAQSDGMLEDSMTPVKTLYWQERVSLW